MAPVWQQSNTSQLLPTSGSGEDTRVSAPDAGRAPTAWCPAAAAAALWRCALVCRGYLHRILCRCVQLCAPLWRKLGKASQTNCAAHPAPVISNIIINLTSTVILNGGSACIIEFFSPSLYLWNILSFHFSISQSFFASLYLETRKIDSSESTWCTKHPVSGCQIPQMELFCDDTVNH